MFKDLLILMEIVKLVIAELASIANFANGERTRTQVLPRRGMTSNELADDVLDIGNV